MLRVSLIRSVPYCSHPVNNTNSSPAEAITNNEITIAPNHFQFRVPKKAPTETAIIPKPATTYTDIDKLTDGKKFGYFVGLMIVNLSVCGVLLETNDATMDTLPFTFYGIAFIVALLVGFFTRKLFVSLDTENLN